MLTMQTDFPHLAKTSTAQSLPVMQHQNLLLYQTVEQCVFRVVRRVAPARRVAPKNLDQAPSLRKACPRQDPPQVHTHTAGQTTQPIAVMPPVESWITPASTGNALVS